MTCSVSNKSVKHVVQESLGFHKLGTVMRIFEDIQPDRYSYQTFKSNLLNYRTCMNE